MPSVSVGDIKIFYQDVGEGEPLVLIMGFGGDHMAWALQMADFSAQYRVIAFDNRGVGQSDAPDHPYTIRMMAGDALGLMDALGVDSAHVIGVSMGGMIAQELALARPDRVRSLHLACTFARPDAYMLALNAAWREMRIGLGRESTLRTLGLWLFSPTTYAERPDFIEALLQNSLANPYPQSLAGFLRQSAAVAAHDALERLPAIRCPTLVSVAEDDILVPSRFAREIAARVPGAELHLVPAAGHGFFLERPDVFNALSLDFIGRTSPKN
ncbi:MAG: alpha/beta hydrolase [Candidatus Rokuibacteriota bacterium]|nr:MAG: alpha/beta hydrolase [Candidatus Rokubacteria bacterium]